MKHRIEIKPREGVGIHFLLDGNDIANQLTSYTIRHSAGMEPPKVEIDLYGESYRALLENADVELQPELAETLVRLGWTPPTNGAAA
jgi:hypothetical protein